MDENRISNIWAWPSLVEEQGISNIEQGITNDEVKISKTANHPKALLVAATPRNREYPISNN